MKIRLDRLGDEPYTWQEAPAITAEDLAHPDVRELCEVRCRGHVSRTDPGFLLQATLTYEQTLGCTRCLRPVGQSLTSRIDLLVRLQGEDVGDPGAVAEELELDDEDLGVLVLAEPVLDTRPILLEQIQLDVPMRTLCSDACKGLCGRCGADLNAGPCSCEPVSDPRWGALARLKNNSGS